MTETKKPKCDWCPPKLDPGFPENFKLTPGRTQYPNPGTVANLHRKTRDIMPNFFDGVEFSYKKGLAPNKTLLTSWVLSHTYPTGFRIGGVYSYRCKGDLMETPTIEADINPSTLSSNFSILYYPTRSLRLETKFQRLCKAKVSENTISLEYARRSSTITLSTYNPSKSSGRITLSYLRSVTENLALGAEMLYEWVDQDTMAHTSLAGRYTTGRYSVATTMSNEAIDISYWRQVHKSIQMGSSLVFHRRTNKAIGSIFYQWDFVDASIRGMVDSDWSVGVLYNRTLLSVPCAFGVSLLYCIPSNRFAFGLTMDLDPSVKCSK